MRSNPGKSVHDGIPTPAGVAASRCLHHRQAGIADGFLTPASLKTQSRQDNRNLHSPLCASAPPRENFPSQSPTQELIPRRAPGAQRRQTAFVPGLLRALRVFACDTSHSAPVPPASGVEEAASPHPVGMALRRVGSRGPQPGHPVRPLGVFASLREVPSDPSFASREAAKAAKSCRAGVLRASASLREIRPIPRHPDRLPDVHFSDRPPPCLGCQAPKTVPTASAVRSLPRRIQLQTGRQTDFTPGPVAAFPLRSVPAQTARAKPPSRKASKGKSREQHSTDTSRPATPPRQRPHPEEPMDGFLTPAWLKTQRHQDRRSVGFCRPAGAQAAGAGEPGLTPGPIICRASGAGPRRPDNEPVTVGQRLHASTGNASPPRACLVLRGFASSREIVLPFPHPLKPATRTSPPRSVTLREVLPGQGITRPILPS